MLVFLKKLKHRFEDMFRRYMLKNKIADILKRKSDYSLNKNERKIKIIVSLTSVPERFKSLHVVVKQMLLQSMKPDRIIVYLDDTISITSVPNSLTELKKYGVEIECRPLDLKPHKKYYYAIKENPDACIITIDDDIIYSRKLVEELYNTSLKFPGCVVAARAHEITFDNRNYPQKYNDWQWESSRQYQPSMRLFATGVGGVLYPPACMYGDLLRYELISKLSLRNDDIWLKAMQVLNGTQVVICNIQIRKEMMEIEETQTVCLNSSNVHKNNNDLFINNIMDYYHFSSKDFNDFL